MGTGPNHGLHDDIFDIRFIKNVHRTIFRLFIGLLMISLLSSIVFADILGELDSVTHPLGIENRLINRRVKDLCDKKRPSSQCSKEEESLYITCGQRSVRYMGELERDIMQYEELQDPTRCLKNSFYDIDEVDFIVVGTGIAGSVVAGRLAEQKAWTVAVLEAGDAAPSASSVPGFYFNYRYDPLLDWNYDMVPQPNACLSNGGVCHAPRGRVMGGTGILHGMMYMRGHKFDYDNLKEAPYFIDDWSWNDVLPYFLKSENNSNVGTPPIEPEYHSTEGPLNVGYFPSHPKFAETMLKAYSELGYKTNIDLNGKSQQGFALAQSTNKKGVRMTTAKAYLFDKINWPNLFILLNSRVTKVVIDDNTMRATGVKYLRDGKTRFLRAKKEVIISGGAIASPQILLLSGIGPKEHLDSVGINYKVDLPGVGQNLNNHLSTELFFRVGEEMNAEVLDDMERNQYFRNHTGALSSTGMSQLTGFLFTNASDPRPDLQIFHAGYMANCSESGTVGERAGPGNKIFSISPTVLSVKSVGYVKLRSLFPTDNPIVYGGIMTDPRDMQTLLRGIRKVEEVLNTQTLKNLKVQLDTTIPKGCENTEFDSDDYWKCYIEHNTNPENHQVGTCRMGIKGDRNAVVDNKLRVFGVKSLRVIDASVLPYTPSGNLQAPTIMVAERGADFIEATWNKTLKYKD